MSLLWWKGWSLVDTEGIIKITKLTVRRLVDFVVNYTVKFADILVVSFAMFAIGVGIGGRCS